MEIAGDGGMRRTVVVTGGAGFIGSHLVDGLVDRGFDVHIVDNMTGGKRERIDPRAAFHEDDVRDLGRIHRVIEGSTYVFHLAASPRVQDSIVVYSASSSAYGDQPVMPLAETMTALSTGSLRYFNVYAPRFDANGAYALVIGKFLKQRAEGQPMTITGDGTQTRDFTHERDVVRANLLAAESDRVGQGEVITIGAGKNVSIQYVAELIGGPVEYIAPRLEPHDALADTTRARRLLGWTPTVPFEEGLSELVASTLSPSAV
jgi:UDP-glucose 4-epimerase